MDQADFQQPINVDVLRAARAMLNWTALECSRNARISVATLISIEHRTRGVPAETYARLVTTYNEAGISFERKTECGDGIYYRQANRAR